MIGNDIVKRLNEMTANLEKRFINLLVGKEGKSFFLHHAEPFLYRVNKPNGLSIKN